MDICCSQNFWRPDSKTAPLLARSVLLILLSSGSGLLLVSASVLIPEPEANDRLDRCCNGEYHIQRGFYRFFIHLCFLCSLLIHSLLSEAQFRL